MTFANSLTRRLSNLPKDYLNFSANVLNSTIFDRFCLEGKDFDIYHCKPKFLGEYPNGTLELALLRLMPTPHAHHNAGTSYFYFIGDNGGLLMGGAGDNNDCYVSLIEARPGVFYPIPPYVFHAGGPRDNKVTRLLILNESGLRERSNSCYPDDTFFKERIIQLKKE